MRYRRAVFLASAQGVRGTSVDGLVDTWLFRFEDPIVNVHHARDGETRRPFVALSNAHIPMSFLVVHARNNTVAVRTGEGGAATTTAVSLPEGNYTPTSLVAALNQALEDAGLVPRVTYEARRLALALVADRSGDDTTPYAFVGSSPLTTAQTILGLEPGEDVLLAGGASATAFPRPVDLAGPRTIFVLVDVPLESSDSSSRSRGVLAAVPVNTRSGTLQYWQPMQLQYHQTSFDQLNTLTVSFVDQNYQGVDLRGVEWTLELEFT